MGAWIEPNDEIDPAYAAGYGGRSPSIVPSLVAAAARAATLELVPRPAAPELEGHT